MTRRKFGVEIECYYPTGAAGCQRDLRAAGFHNWADQYIHYDGSNCEIPSPVLQGKSGLNQLKEIFDFLLSKKARVTSRDGMHVHHDAPEFVNNPEAVLRLVKSWNNATPVVNRFVAARRRGHYFCEPWRPYHIERLEEHVKERNNSNYYHARGDLNIAALREHGTIEIRLHEGTLDYERAEAWVLFGQSFMDRVARTKRPLKVVDNPQDLLKLVKVNEKAQKRLEQRYRLSNRGRRRATVDTA